MPQVAWFATGTHAVPDDWNASGSSIELVGAGSNGGARVTANTRGGRGGGGGAYLKQADVTLTAGNYTVTVPQGNAGIACTFVKTGEANLSVNSATATAATGGTAGAGNTLNYAGGSGYAPGTGQGLGGGGGGSGGPYGAGSTPITATYNYGGNADGGTVIAPTTTPANGNSGSEWPTAGVGCGTGASGGTTAAFAGGAYGGGGSGHGAGSSGTSGIGAGAALVVLTYVSSAVSATEVGASRDSVAIQSGIYNVARSEALTPTIFQNYIYAVSVTEALNPVETVTTPSHTISLIVSPPSPEITDAYGPSDVVASLTGHWNDDTIFGGNFTFWGPLWDCGGVYAIAQSAPGAVGALIINPSGPGVGAAGGTVEHVTLEAHDPSVLNFHWTSDVLTISDHTDGSVTSSTGITEKAIFETSAIHSAETARALLVGSLTDSGAVTERASFETARLTLNVNPPSPQVQATDLPGTLVATLTGIWSDGRLFAGRFVFVAPNYNNFNIYSITQSALGAPGYLIIDPAGPGLTGGGDVLDTVTIIARDDSGFVGERVLAIEITAGIPAYSTIDVENEALITTTQNGLVAHTFPVSAADVPVVGDSSDARFVFAETTVETTTAVDSPDGSVLSVGGTLYPVDVEETATPSDLPSANQNFWSIIAEVGTAGDVPGVSSSVYGVARAESPAAASVQTEWIRFAVAVATTATVQETSNYGNVIYDGVAEVATAADTADGPALFAGRAADTLTISATPADLWIFNKARSETSLTFDTPSKVFISSQSASDVVTIVTTQDWREETTVREIAAAHDLASATYTLTVQERLSPFDISILTGPGEEVKYLGTVAVIERLKVMVAPQPLITPHAVSASEASDHITTTIPDFAMADVVELEFVDSAVSTFPDRPSHSAVATAERRRRTITTHEIG